MSAGNKGNLAQKKPSSAWRWAWLLCALAAAFFVSQLEFILPLRMHNGRIFFTRYPIEEEDWDHPRLKLLRDREKLDQVIAPGATEFEKIVLLRKWAHTRWTGGDNKFYYPPWDAMEIIDLARRHGNQAFCAQYAIVFLQGCLAMGIPARYVDLPGHFVAEAWSNEYRKWVVMDPTHDVYYERDGKPLNGRRLCEAYWKDKWSDIFMVGSDGTRTPVKKDDLYIYRMFSIVLRNNHLTRPEEISVNGAPARPLALRKDYREYPFVGKDSVGFGADFVAWKQEGETEFAQGKNYSDDPEDFRDRVNQSVIEIVSTEPQERLVKLELRPENSSTFQTFQISGRTPPDWQPSGRMMLWRLAPGMNTLSVRIQTRFGWIGPQSDVTVFYKPRWVKSWKAIGW